MLKNEPFAVNIALPSSHYELPMVVKNKQGRWIAVRDRPITGFPYKSTRYYGPYTREEILQKLEEFIP